MMKVFLPNKISIKNKVCQVWKVWQKYCFIISMKSKLNIDILFISDLEVYYKILTRNVHVTKLE